MCFHVPATLLLALSTSSDIVRTWRHLSASSMSAPHSYMVPICSAANPIQEAREVPECAEVQKPHPWFLPFVPSHCSGVLWDEQRGYQHPLCHGDFGNKNTNHPGITRECFGTSWQHCQGSGVFLHLISILPTPRESTETPWGVSSHWVDCKWEKHRHCTPFLSVQCRQLFYMYCRYILYIIYAVLKNYVCDACRISSRTEEECNAQKLIISAKGRW